MTARATPETATVTGKAPLRVLDSPEAVGELLAARILASIATAHAAGRHFLLGCPTGRTPKPIFHAMAKRLADAAGEHDLSRVVLLMMDEYLVPDEGRALRWAPEDAPWSCHWFARHEIMNRLNAALSRARRIADDAAWFPDPRDPAAYDARIADAGGIDFFLLASGASDGHVAFNPPGSPRDSRTRVIPLSEETRRDNLQTFPVFGTLETVPHHGVSVGIATITGSREAVMVALGAGKRETVSRMRAAERYDASWPATLIHECRNAEIVCDREAAGEG
jgi:glucosamine-6-phosphate deaminase